MSNSSGDCVEKKMESIGSLDELIAELRRVFESDKVNVEHVKELLSAYRSNPRDWKKYAQFDAFRYTRNLVDTGNGKYNMMLLCWGERHGSSIHDHSDSHCFVKVLDGQLRETMFAWPEQSITEDGQTQVADTSDGQPLTEINVNVYPKEGVTYINDSMGLHRIENPSHTCPAVSLHLYSPPFDTCRTYDQRTGMPHTVKMTFWSEYGERKPFITTVNECSQVSTEAAPSVAAVSAN